MTAPATPTVSLKPYQESCEACRITGALRCCDPTRCDGMAYLDEATGLTMQTNRWYIVSDSGSFYTSQGFQTKDYALNYTESEEFIKDFGRCTVAVPVYDQATHQWNNNWDEVNIISAADNLDFYKHNSI